jgi:arylsulfatase
MGTAEGFTGVIGRYRDESEAAWPEPIRAAPGSPNVLVVLLDDVGFAQFGCFGGSIPTPTFDALAASGLRYANFHTTALCSPTRACVLTGRNHHSVGMGRIVDLATGFPGYDARIPDSAAMLPAMLVEAGYAAYAVGKWHLTPDDELHMGATRARWPLAKGFERFYGFMEGETNQFAPSLVHDNHAVGQPKDFEDGYHLTEDLVDHAIGFVADLRNSEVDKPFLVYLTPGACHSPHQAPAEWVARFAGAYDHGWDLERERIHARQVAEGILPAHTELSARPEWVPAWDSLPPEEQRLYARYMECFAAYLAHFDHHLGRLLRFLEHTGDLDDTLVMLMSDNGASSEGGPTGSVNDIRPWNIAPRDLPEALERIEEIGGPWIHNNYPWGWTVAGNTPFRRWKRETHEGGVCDPLVVCWPAGIDATHHGAVRRQYAHAIDVVPTVLDVLGLVAPGEVRGVPQQPIEGVSFAGSFDDPVSPSLHRTQYYEMLGCRALYHDGWKAVTHHPIFDTSVPFDEDRWELYDLEADPSECHDLAGSHPERLDEMIGLWWREAEAHRVLPLDNAPFDLVFADPRPGTVPRQRYVYHPGTAPVPEAVAVNLRNRSHVVVAEVDLGDAPGSAEGVLVAQGSGYGGWTLYAQGGRLHYLHNFVGLEQQSLRAQLPSAPGLHALGYRFTKSADHAGVVELVIDGEVVDRTAIERFTPVRWAITGEGLCVGFQDGLPVSRDYRGPFRFSGALQRVVVEVEGPESVEPEAEAELSMRAQ